MQQRPSKSVDTSPKGTSADIPEALQPCGPIQTDMDLSTYESMVFGNFQGAVQYNGEQPSAPTVKMICEAVTASTITTNSDDSNATSAASNGLVYIDPDDALHRLAAATALFIANKSAPFSKRCVQSNFTKDYLSDIANISFGGE